MKSLLNPHQHLRPTHTTTTTTMTTTTHPRADSLSLAGRKPRINPAPDVMPYSNFHLFWLNSLKPISQRAGLWAHDSNLILMIRSGHNFAPATTAELSGHHLLKIVTWSDHIYFKYEQTFFYKIRVVNSETVTEMDLAFTRRTMVVLCAWRQEDLGHGKVIKYHGMLLLINALRNITMPHTP